MEDPEEEFFDQPPRVHGVRRDTIVFELTAEDAIAVGKLKSDVAFYLFYEAALFGMVLIVIFAEPNILTAAIMYYLISFLAINGIAFILKFVLLN